MAEHAVLMGGQVKDYNILVEYPDVKKTLAPMR
jgi:hypothetical protein